jgi:hypothetical protein
MSVAELVIGVLAVWRVTHLLHAEDGPWQLSARLRRAAGSGFPGRLLDCFYCLSLWIAIPAALVMAEDWVSRVLLWLGLSGGAVVIQRLLPPEVEYHEDPRPPER